MTKVDTMSKEKRCDWCFTSAQSKQAKTMGRDTSGGEGTRALSRLQYFFDTCPLLCKFVQDCVKDPEHNLEYLMLSCPNWNLRVHHDRNTCVNALRSLSGSKPFLMIEWGTPWNTPGRARITIFGRQTADYSHSAIISRACLRSIERCYWGDKEAQLKIQVLKFNLH